MYDDSHSYKHGVNPPRVFLCLAFGLSFCTALLWRRRVTRDAHTVTVRAAEARAHGKDSVPGQPLPEDQRQAGRPQCRSSRQASLRAGREWRGQGNGGGGGCFVLTVWV